MEDLFEVEYTKFEKFLKFIGWYKFRVFIEDWIYPAHYIRNFLFHRYDRIKIKEIKPYEYLDVDITMFYACMELVVRFIEKEEPEKYINWYDDEYTKGSKYGDNSSIYGEKDKQVLFPEYKGRYIMDIIKEIYDWYKNKYPVMINDVQYMIDFAFDNNLYGKMMSKEIKDMPGHFQIINDTSYCPKSIDELKDVNWEILDKYIENREDILKERCLINKRMELEKKIEEEKQKYLHLCIEVRPYLWT